MRSLRAETVSSRDGSTSLPERFRRQLSPETRYVDLPDPLTLESGSVLPKVTVAYRTWGHIKNARHRAILICHALTGSADADTWWPGIIGAGCAFDPARDFVICSNILGSCYGTSGPVSAHPERDGAYRSDFPQISIRDMVTVQAALLDYLGIDQLQLVTGPSLGGMQVLEWASMYPERVRSIIPVGVSGRHSAWCIGISEAQRAAIEADPNWNNGAYMDEAPPDKGLSAARMMAMCSYRSWDNLEQRFSRECRTDGVFQVQAYLRYQGQKINARFDANTYIRLTQAMDSHDIARGRGSYPEVLRGIRHPALVVAVTSDILYPPAEQELLARLLPDGELRVLDSNHGHDGFLIKTRELGNLIAAFRLALNARQDDTALRAMPSTIAAF
jgi:homoserine O-acetyltransferase/O-succinyltransferase